MFKLNPAGVGRNPLDERTVEEGVEEMALQAEGTAHTKTLWKRMGCGG